MSSDRTHVVRVGECIKSIAYDRGFFWQTIWNDSQNAALKELRRDPGILLEGDRVYIPPKETKQEHRSSGARHRFRRKGTPLQIVFVIRKNGAPVKNTPYVAKIDGNLMEGGTDPDGRIRLSIPPNARAGELMVGKGEGIITYLLNLGGMDPVDQVTGLQHRLDNLGYFTQPDKRGVLGPMTREALKKFQRNAGLRATGEPDDLTKTALKDKSGC